MNTKEIEDYNLKYPLRDYQFEFVKNAVQIYNSEKHNRFACGIMPTGSGKSFVAMALLQIINNKNFNVNSPGNNSKMLYIAPTKDILFQIKLHIVKTLYIPNKKNFENSDMINMTTEQILEPKNVDEIVKILFPNLKFKCYAGIKGLIDENDPDILKEEDSKEADFIIIDEAHRAGADDWTKNISKIIENTNAKILALSATPERNDANGKEMMLEIAKMVYPNEVIKSEEYIAQEIYVVDAMKDGIINSPKIINSGFFLYYSKEYLSVLKAWRNTENIEKKEKLANILDEMENIIGISSKHYENRQIPEEIIVQKRISVINENIKVEINSDNPYEKMEPNDKAIVFIPNRNSSDDNREEFFNKYIDEVKQYYKGVIDPKTGKEIEVIPHILSSDYKQITNNENLSEFENSSNNLPGVHILFVQAKGAEGLHIDGGKIVYDLRGGEKSNIAMQKIGRVISSLNPNVPLHQQNKTRFFDIKTSMFRQSVNHVGARNSIKYDIYRINKILEWVNSHGRYPNINAGTEDITNLNLDNKEQALAEEEARMAYAIKRYQLLARQYTLGYNVEPDKEEEVNKFLEILKNFPGNFMEIETGIRVKEPFEKDLIGSKFLQLSYEQEKFLELFDKAKELSSERGISSKTRIDKLMHVLQVLTAFKPNLQLPPGIITKETISYRGVQQGQREIESDVGALSLDLKTFLKANFSNDKIKEIMFLLRSGDTRKTSYNGENYDFGRELAHARGLFLTAEKDSSAIAHSPFETYEIKNILNSGLIDFRRCPELINDIYKMFGLKANDYLDYFNTEKITFKKEIDIKKIARNNEQRYNEKNSSRRKIPYSNKKFGVLDKFSGISLITGEKVLTEKEKERQNAEKERNKIKEEYERKKANAQQKELEAKRKEEERRKFIREKIKANKKRKYKTIKKNPEAYYKKNSNNFEEYQYHHILYGSNNRPVFSFYSVCDERGFVLERNEETGKLEYHLLKDIMITRYVMQQMIGNGKSFEDVCKSYCKIENIENIEDAKEDIGFFIANTLDYYSKIPTILDPQQDDSGELIFSGIDELLNSRGDIQKKQHIQEFIDIVDNYAYKDIIQIRKSILEKDKEIIKALSKTRGKSKEQLDALFEAEDRKRNASYIEDELR